MVWRWGVSTRGRPARPQPRPQATGIWSQLCDDGAGHRAVARKAEEKCLSWDSHPGDQGAPGAAGQGGKQGEGQREQSHGLQRQDQCHPPRGQGGHQRSRASGSKAGPRGLYQPRQGAGRDSCSSELWELLP